MGGIFQKVYVDVPVDLADLELYRVQRTVEIESSTHSSVKA